MAGTRIETGPTQFGSDWPGLFVRGDDCMRFACALQAFLERHPIGNYDAIDSAPVKGLLEMLRSTDTRRRVVVQKLKEFEQCLTPKDRKKGKTSVS